MMKETETCDDCTYKGFGGSKSVCDQCCHNYDDMFLHGKDDQ